MVGVCGDVPRNGDQEILLGDVDISKSVVQYDVGYQYPDRFQSENILYAGPEKPSKDI